MRKIIIAGNWKMNLGAKAAKDLAEGIKAGIDKLPSNKEVMVFPSTIHLPMVTEILKGTRAIVGVQNIYPSTLAAYTGETCIDQIKDYSISHVLLGHSERRQFLGESDEFLNKKLHFCINNGATPVFCIGETLAEREANQTISVIKRQLTEGLKGLTPQSCEKIILAYEPVWAIGTGKVATPEQAQEVHATVRAELASLFGKATADTVSILYGGSVKPDNVKSLLDMADIDGALVGGASQKTESYLALF